MLPWVFGVVFGKLSTKQEYLRRIIYPQQQNNDPPAAPKLDATALLPMYQLMSDFPTVNKMPVTTAPMATSPHSRLRSGKTL